MLNLKLRYFGYLMRRADSFEKTLMLGKIEGGRRRGRQGWDGWMASPTQWTWVLDSGNWWWTGRFGVLWFMGLQRVRHDWVTELNWTERASQVLRKKQDNWPKVNEDLGGRSCISDLHHLLTVHLLTQFSSVQSLSRVRLFAIPWTAVHQASLSITNSQSPPKPMSTDSVMLYSHLFFCHPLFLLHSIFPSIRVSSSELTLHIRWPKYWSFSFSSKNMPVESILEVKISEIEESHRWYA